MLEILFVKRLTDNCRLSTRLATAIKNSAVLTPELQASCPALSRDSDAHLMSGIDASN